ncbi:SURF1 family protein [Chenggangzhangella methanolivorans]|uniref:SURF1-like protein n=1 Tax=Chenggangzhangella methanolivorans TaxID=1437009 RepID=A0A9E6R7M1_9HYPH|nr:SURF1 family protein [Chenggangzhangella methanolivorans]QZN98769.1 SURF1 family protein [Chenggangzhangella methanolivorans]
MRRAGLWKAAAATAIAVALLVGLGSWQLARLSWKTELVARVSERMAAEPVALPPPADWPSLDLAAWSYRRVRAKGTFDHEREARVFVNLSEPRGPLKGPGYFLMTPLRLSGGGLVIVNRGFAPEGAVGRAARPEGEVEVSGPLREAEDRNMFTPADDPGRDMFFARDPKAIAAGLHLDNVAPFTVDAEATAGAGPLPQAGETRVSFPNRHMEYALTWYGLAATLAAVFGAFAWRTVREAE